MEFEVPVLHELSPTRVSAEALGSVPLKPGAGLPQAAEQTLQPHGPLVASVAGRLRGLRGKSPGPGRALLRSGPCPGGAAHKWPACLLVPKKCLHL